MSSSIHLLYRNLPGRGTKLRSIGPLAIGRGAKICYCLRVRSILIFAGQGSDGCCMLVGVQHDRSFWWFLLIYDGGRVRAIFEVGFGVSFFLFMMMAVYGQLRSWFRGSFLLIDSTTMVGYGQLRSRFRGVFFFLFTVWRWSDTGNCGVGFGGF